MKKRSDFYREAALLDVNPPFLVPARCCPAVKRDPSSRDQPNCKRAMHQKPRETVRLVLSKARSWAKRPT